MKKLYLLAFATFFMAACSGDDNGMSNITEFITFNVTDNNMMPNPDVIPSDAMSRSSFFYQNTSFSAQTTSTPVETDLRLDTPLTLSTTIEDGINRTDNSKATRTTLINNNSSFSFGVSEFKTGSSTAVGSFTNLSFSTTANATTAQKVNTGVAWEGDAKNTTYLFYAYAPYLSETANGLSLTDNNTKISYDARLSVNSQQDLMTAYATSTYTTSGVNLTFEHRLTAITIKLNTSSWSIDNVGWNENYTIKSVKFENINYKNKLNISTGLWSTTASDITNDDYSVSGITESSTADGTVVANLMMIPQNLGANAKLTITIQDNSTAPKTHTLTASLSGTTWVAGKTVTYEIGTQGISTFQAEYPTGTNAWGGSVQGPVSDYHLTTSDANEKFGMYVVNGSTLVYSNIEMKVTTAGATATLTPTNGNKYFFSKNYKYFLYYPYKSGYTSSSVSPSESTAANFFASMISGWTVAPNQSGGIQSSDLQVAALSGSTFKMVHKMGLARLQLNAPSNIPYNKVYRNNSYDETQSNTLNSGKGTASRSAVASFDTYVPCLFNGVYYYVLNGSVTINSVQNDVNKWTEGHTFTQSAGTVSNIWTAYSVRYDWDAVNLYYEYTGGSSYTFTIPTSGNYLVQCWGASGGTGALSGYDQVYINEGSYYGRGAYTEGYINLTTSTNGGRLYVYVGGKGTNAVCGKSASGGYNGGGAASWDGNDAGGGGGGATDIRLTNNATAWSSRIMVAGGGGGGCCNHHPSSSKTEGMHAGNPNVSGGCSGWSDDLSREWTPTVNQSAGNALGQGDGLTTQAWHGRGGGGGGYWGGTTSDAARGAGGSSYISGNAACTASNNMTFTGSSFKKGTNASVPSMTIGGTAAALGQVNGYARFSLIRE